MKNKKPEYHTNDAIRAMNARYNLIFGMRSNGKSYSVLYDALKEWAKNGRTLAIIRRWTDDFSGANSARTYYDSLECNGYGKNVIKELTGYDGVEYWAGKYYLTQFDDKKQQRVRTDKVIAYGFALDRAEKTKGSQFPSIGTVLLDEYMTRERYLVDEFSAFMTVLSTIVRRRDDVKIFMCANTVNKYGCPYYKEMGLYRIKDMRPGTIDVYEYGETGLRVAVEYSDSPAKKTPSDVYFAFNNPTCRMNTTGDWEIDIYPHLPAGYVIRPADIKFRYFIEFDGQRLQGDVVAKGNEVFSFIHRKTGEYKDPDRDLIFAPDAMPGRNRRTRITKPADNITKAIWSLHATEKVFYQDNDVGEVVNSYINWCKTV